MGIHYDYKSKRGERAMLKEAKRKARLAQRRAKKIVSSESSELLEKEEVKTHDIKKTITFWLFAELAEIFFLLLSTWLFRHVLIYNRNVYP